MIEIIPNWHPVFVHFTVALLIVAAALHLLSRLLSRSDVANQLTIVVRWNFWIGLGFTLFTVVAGWYAYNTVAHDAPSHLAMSEHRNWAMATFMLLLGIAGWEYYLSRQGKGRNWLFTGLLVIAAGLLLSTAWHGAELVYRYGLGVMSLPKPEAPGHTHEHGDDHGDMPAQGEDAHGKSGHAHGRDDAANVTGAAPGKAGHTHAPGTPPHRD
ncbi:MAG: DUF2231 domain-containing protein [Pseudomonadota bacterium]